MIRSASDGDRSEGAPPSSGSATEHGDSDDGGSLNGTVGREQEPFDPQTPLLQQLLEEQQQLTAVERFAKLHESERTPESRYRALLPATAPGPGQQYAFDVDLDACSGCKACVTACHSMNGLDERETWRDVGLVVGGTSSLPVLQHVTAACHHCVQPGCMEACPVNAYVKDPETGIVKHLDDQCFGCQYCTLACPYDVPKYHAEKGIVRKCDMCSSRLSVGEAPACVQACPHEAIRIQIVDVQQVIDDAEANVFLPAAPDPQLTLPTTTYRTTRVFPRNALPADYYEVSPQHPHLPLVVMLVLTQASVGAFIVALLLENWLTPESREAWRVFHAPFALGCGLLALGASTCHLGRPHLAFRAVLGIGHSWLSREIVAFGLFAGLASAYSILVSLPSSMMPSAFSLTPAAINGLAWSVAVVGVIAVFCSAMIYIATQREVWNFPRTSIRFGLSTALLGAATSSFTLLIIASTWSDPVLDAAVIAAVPWCLQALVVLATAKVLWDAAGVVHLSARRMTTMKRTALLMTKQLAHITIARFAVGVLAGIVTPLLLLSNQAVLGSVQMAVVLALVLGGCLLGEGLERYLFFAAASSPRMPGGIR